MWNNGSRWICELPEFVHNHSHAFKVMWKSHLSAVWSRVPPLYYSIALSTKFIIQKKKTRLFALLEGEVEQNRLSLALISFLLPKKNDESVVRLCFSGLSGSHKPLHVASPAARRKPCVNGFSCNVVIISSRLTLVLITKLFSPLPSSEECCWQQIFWEVHFCFCCCSYFLPLTVFFIVCNLLQV